MNRLFVSPSFRLFIVASIAVLTTACGFNFRGTYLLPDEVSRLSFTSYDSYNALTRYVRTELHMNGVDMVPPSENTPNLHLVSGSSEERTLSLYQNSRAAEYELTYTATFRVTIPNVGAQTYSTTVNRSYLDNPLTALAKSEEKEMILDEMEKLAARQILRQMARLKAELEKEEQLIDDGVTQSTETKLEESQ